MGRQKRQPHHVTWHKSGLDVFAAYRYVLDDGHYQIGELATDAEHYAKEYHDDEVLELSAELRKANKSVLDRRPAFKKDVPGFDTNIKESMHTARYLYYFFTLMLRAGGLRNRLLEIQKVIKEEEDMIRKIEEENGVLDER